MKYLRFLIIIFLLAVVFSCSKKKPAEINFKGNVNLLPDNTIFFFEFKNLKKYYNKFIRTKFYSEFIRISLAENFNPVNINNEIKNKFSRFIRNETIINSITHLIGNDIIFSIHPSKNNTMVLNIISTMDDKPQKSEYIFNKLTEYLKNNTSLIYRKKEYRKIKIHSVIISGSQISEYLPEKLETVFFRFNNKLVLSSNREAALKFADTLINNPVNNFVKKPAIQKIFSQISPEESCLIYFEPLSITQFIKNKNLFQSYPFIDSIIQLGETIKSSGISVTPKLNTHIKSFSLINYKSNNKRIIDFLEKKPNVIKSTYLVPLNSIFYLALQNFDIKLLLDSLKFGQKKTGTSVNSEETGYTWLYKYFYKNFNLDLKKDIIDNLDKESAVALLNINLDDMIPIPEISFLLKVKDQTKFKSILDTSIKHLSENIKVKLPLIETDHEKEKIFYTKLPSGADINISFYFKNNFTVISSSIDSSKKIIDTSLKKQKNISEKYTGKDYQTLNEFMHLNFKKLVDKIDEIAFTYKELYDKDDEIYINKIKPALKLLASLKTITYNEKFKNNGIDIECDMHFEDIK